MADQEEESELELEVELDSELELVLDVELEVDVDVAAAVAPAAFTAMFAPSPMKAAKLNAPASTRDLAATCRRRRDRVAPIREGRAVDRAWLLDSISMTPPFRFRRGHSLPPHAGAILR